MKNLFEINETVSFFCGLNAPVITKVLDLKWGEASKMWLYKLEHKPGVFFSEKSLSKVEQPKAKLKNEDVYSMQKIERIIEDEENEFYNRFTNRFK
jgi:hypothetical protein